MVKFLSGRGCAWWSLRLSLFVVLSSLQMTGQTLARQGWAGSGISVDPWWKQSILYQLDPLSFQDSNGDGFGDLRGVVDRLDYLAGLGVDVVILSPFQLQPAFEHTGSPPALDPRTGTQEDFDQLVAEAGRRKIRIVVDLPIGPSRSPEQLASVSRFWLSRGVAGLRLVQDASAPGMLLQADRELRLQELHRIANSYMGQRILLWDQAAAVAGRPADVVPSVRSARHRGGRATAHHVQQHGSPATTQMTVDHIFQGLPAFSAPDLQSAFAHRVALQGSTPVISTDGNDRVRSFDRYGGDDNAKAVAALLLTTDGAPLLYFGQEIGLSAGVTPPGRSVAGDDVRMQWGGDSGSTTTGAAQPKAGSNAETANVSLEDPEQNSLLNWYRKLAELRHRSDVLHNGSLEVLASGIPEVVCWVRRSGASPPVVVVLNLSSHAEIIPLTSELHRLGISPGSGLLRTLATTGPETPQSTAGISLPAHGVYLGELRPQPGLESVTLPVRSSRSRKRGR